MDNGIYKNSNEINTPSMHHCSNGAWNYCNGRCIICDIYSRNSTSRTPVSNFDMRINTTGGITTYPITKNYPIVKRFY